MPVNELHICMGCMSQQEQEGICTVCGYDPMNAVVDHNYLAPRSNVGGRYLAGKLASSDPEGAWYVGFDKKDRKRIWIREYAPQTLSTRDFASGTIIPNNGVQAQYKALMADFDDLCKAIARLPESERVIPILDMVYAGHTIYAIYRYTKMISLESFLNRSGGKLSWRHTKKLLMPLYHTVANIHKAGLIHRGLSPQTVMLDQTGALWLNCFSVAAARTNKSELTAQLFTGYAAPEQYQINSWQGIWTDVYALGAITYRALKGENPPSAVDRVYGDDLFEPGKSDLTDIVAAAINKALAVEVEDRTQTAESMIAELLAHEGSNTAIYATPVKPKQNMIDERSTGEIPAQRLANKGTARSAQKQTHKPAGNATRRKRPKRRRINSALLLILSALMATAALALGISWFSTNYLDDLLFPSTDPVGSVVQGVDFTVNQQDDTKVPKFVGATISSIESNVAIAKNYEITIREAFNSDYEKGVVFDQQPIEGTELPADRAITLFISKGTEMVEMPVVVGLPIDEALELLKGMEIQTQVIEVFNSSYEPDVVVKCDREPESQIDKNKDTVVLYIKRADSSLDSSSELSNEDQSSSSSKKSSSSKSASSERLTDRVQSKSSSSEGGRLLKPK